MSMVSIFAFDTNKSCSDALLVSLHFIPNIWPVLCVCCLYAWGMLHVQVCISSWGSHSTIGSLTKSASCVIGKKYRRYTFSFSYIFLTENPNNHLIKH